MGLADHDGLTFDVMDYGGQPIYAKTNQYFVVRRALYLLVWNVTKGSLEELQMMISAGLRAAQARAPGASLANHEWG